MITLHFADLPTPHLPDPRATAVTVEDFAWSYFFAAVKFEFERTAWPVSEQTATLDFYGSLVFALDLMRRDPTARHDFGWKECDSRLLYTGQGNAVALQPSWVDDRQIVDLVDLKAARQQVRRQIELAMLRRYAGLDTDGIFACLDARSLAAAERRHPWTTPEPSERQVDDGQRGV